MLNFAEVCYCFLCSKVYLFVVALFNSPVYGWNNTLMKKKRTSPNKRKKENASSQSTKGNTLLGTNISPQKGTVEDEFPFPKVGLC